jgi:tellurite resistance protein TerC
MTFLVWGGFIVVVLALLALDLGVLNRTPHEVKPKEALRWTAFWVSLAMSFNLFIYFGYTNHWLGLGVTVGHQVPGIQAATEFLTAYLVEQSLSLDNIFVIALIFGYFGIPLRYQHKVLFWGIVGVLVMRGAMIIGGLALINKFESLTYIFGAMLIFTAIKLMTSTSETVDPEHNPLVKLTRRMVPVVNDIESGKFFTRVDGKFAVTTMFLVLMMVETTDLFFAIDSIPACFAVTQDPFIVFTSNIFAVLGLRSMYFALASVMDKFRYLKQSLIFLLAFIGVKMLLVHIWHIPTWVSLAFIAGILSVGVGASIVAARRDAANGHSEQTEFGDGLMEEGALPTDNDEA